jgi:transcription termination factor Rho
MNPPSDGKGSTPNRRRRRGRGGRARQQGQGTDNHRQGGGQARGRRGNGGPRNALVDAIPSGEPSLEVRGVLQLSQPGHGHLRSPQADYLQEPTDPIVPRCLIRELELEDGVELVADAVPRDGGGPPIVAVIRDINPGSPIVWSDRRPFKTLVAEDPDQRIRLESAGDEISTRVVDLIAPIGKGQRCLIVAPPKAGKTVLLQKIAQSVTENHPEIHLTVLLVDERPEEVTDMRRTVKGEVIASSSDEEPSRHLQVAEMALERCKRLVECGRDVVILLDSITRLARAYNSQQRSSGRILSGGVDARTMEKPRRFFGAARKAVDGGSLTVIGTALVDTGSRMDEVIFQEFKGTGNTEIIMDRGMFEQRIFPAIDISGSGTRKEEKLLTPNEYAKITLLRRALAPLRAAEAMQLLTGRLAKHPSNEVFLETMA